jgi:hypothetical protein
MRRPSTRRAAGLLIAIAILLGATAGALAYWSGSGTGSATTVLANVQPLSFEPGAPTAQLSPGGEAGVAIVANNPNPFFVEISSMVLDNSGGGAFAVDGVNGSGCDVSVLGFISQDNGGAGWQVPPRAGSSDGTLAINMPDAITMSTSAADACQGATFSVHLQARR